MNRMIPAIVAIGVAASGMALAQTTNPSPSTAPPATTPTPVMPAPGATTPTPGAPGTLGSTTPAAPSGPSTSTAPAAVTTTDAPTRTTEAPVPGANSFTEGQAKARMEERGYTQLTEIRKDDQGIWRAKGMKDGQSVGVALDYQGNIVTQ